MPNRLALASSPYLRQHADNPVDWYPWGAEALERARSEQKPILLSVGYAACHWCHVMAHESFEAPATAAVMNEHFVNIKVDREERPDIDAIYMQSVIALTGHGGWPMTVFLTPEGEPFYGGTYYPPQDRHGMPSFTRVLRAIADAWRNQPADVAATARQLRDVLSRAAQPRESSGELDRRTLDAAYRGLAGAFDPRNGGFGDAPKFPPSMALDFLLRYWARTGQAHALEMVVQTYRAMSRGGIYDQLGGGLHRYSVDAVWLVPHFEKMLYDNALFARLGVHLWQATGDDEVRRTVERTLDWVLREMRSPEGPFFSSLDADSEGHEGTFYLWDDAELDRLLGEDATIARQHWGVTRNGNFEGRNILHVPQDLRATVARSGRPEEEVVGVIERARATLLAERGRRVRPGLDDKVLASWNGLMVRAFAEAARVLGRDDYRDAALAAGRFLADVMVRDGRVIRSIRAGVSSGAGVLEDYAGVGLAFLDLYSLTYDRDWFQRARQLAAASVDLFFDEETGAFFDTARDHEALIVRPRDVADNALPSGNSLAAELLLRMADLAEIESWREIASRVVQQSSDAVAQAPNFFGHLLGVADALVFGSVQVALAGAASESSFRALEARLRESYVPSLIVAAGMSEGPDDPVALLRGRGPRNGKASAYVCRRFVCEAPTSEPSELTAQLASAPRQ